MPARNDSKWGSFVEIHCVFVALRPLLPLPPITPFSNISTAYIGCQAAGRRGAINARPFPKQAGWIG